MRYIEAFRDPALGRLLAARIASRVQPGRRYRLMEFCGGHTHAIARHGLQGLLPPEVELIHGPGCPVCVLPAGRLQQAIELAARPELTLCTYADCLRVPAAGGDSLFKAKARGADVRALYSPDDALALARRHPEREVVFFAVGFETTTPPTAQVLLQARAEGLRNFSVLCCHVLTPAAMAHVVDGGAQIDGFIGPAHVSVVIGLAPYQALVRQLGLPIVIAGFEPLDLLEAIDRLLLLLNAGRAEVDNEYRRAVRPEGNRAAQAAMAAVFETRESFEWRGLGSLPASALRLRADWAEFDAEARFAPPHRALPDHPQCLCGPILRGLKTPRDCKLFGSACRPEHPLGACMVSSEGSCAAAHAYSAR